MAKTASKSVCKAAGPALKFLNWNMNSTASSDRLETLGIPHIVVQTMEKKNGKGKPGSIVENCPECVVSDKNGYYEDKNHEYQEINVIHKDVALAKKLMEKKKQHSFKNTKFISAKNTEYSHSTLEDDEVEILAQEVNNFLQRENNKKKNPLNNPVLHLLSNLTLLHPMVKT